MRAPTRHPLPVTLAIAAALLPGALRAQTCVEGAPVEIVAAVTGQTQEVTLVGGSRHLGRVVTTDDPVRFELLSGDVLEIARERITCLRPVSGTLQGDAFWHDDPNDTRLFFGPTGRALPRGQGYFSVVEVVMPFLSFGITDRLTFSAGTPLIFTSEGPALAWLAPKLEVVRTDAFRGSVGVLAFFVRDAGSGGVLYAVGTFGRTTDRAVTAGIGWGYTGEDGIYEAPALMLGGETRVGPNTKLMTENYLFPDEGFGILAAGPRFFGERLSADLALALPVGPDMDGELFVFPLINFAWNW